MSLLIDIKQGNFVWWCGTLSYSPSQKSILCKFRSKGLRLIFCFLFILCVKAHFNFILVNTKYTRKCLLHQCRGSIHNSCIFKGIRQTCQPEEKFGISRKIRNTFGVTHQPSVSLQRRLWNGTVDPLAHGWNKPFPLTINYNHSQQRYTSDRKHASPADIHTVSLQGSALRIPVFTVFLWAGVFFTLKLLLEEIVLGPTWHLKAVRREVMQIRDGSSSMTCKTFKQQKLICISPAY